PQGWAGVGLTGAPELKGAADFILSAGVQAPIFNEYESGGPLIFDYGGWRKVFIDGRNAEYPPPLFLDALHWYQPRVWASLEARWDFGAAVIRRHPTGAWTTRVLDTDPHWTLAYWDDEAMVYLRDYPENKKLIDEYGLPLLQPGRGNDEWVEELVKQGKGRELYSELDRSVRRAPRCVNARLMLAYVLVRLDRPAEGAAQAKAAVDLAPGSAQPLFTLGWARMALGDREEAGKDYRLALAALKPAERAGLGADLLNDLGRLAELKGDRKAAAALYKKAVSWNPAQGDALANLRRLEGF
ncbi:MAG: hypothetical protein KGL53_11320, partial [Elusimicrobia bacterium]|nr:hypothetical protein [Elusimicrobiota bacterium]